MAGWQTGVYFGLAFILSGCGYSFQTSRSEFLQQRGISRVFLPPTVNESFKPGVEMIVHNAVIKALVSRGVLRIVTDREQADAELITAVNQAQYGPAALAEPSNLGTVLPGVTDRIPSPDPQPLGYRPMSVAQSYSGGLGVQFLLRRLKDPAAGAAIWSGGFARSQAFAGANQLDVPGTTSALINESEFDRVLAEIATQIATDAHDALVAAF